MRLLVYKRSWINNVKSTIAGDIFTIKTSVSTIKGQRSDDLHVHRGKENHGLKGAGGGGFRVGDINRWITDANVYDTDVVAISTRRTATKKNEVILNMSANRIINLIRLISSLGCCLAV
jgi:hypothetical protein